MSFTTAMTSERNLTEGFCKFITNLHSCPALPASFGSKERVFSTFGSIWTKLRNREELKKHIRQLVIGMCSETCVNQYIKL